MLSRITKLVVTGVLVLTVGVMTAAAFTKTVTIKVEGMKCAKCSASVSKALKATEGVQDAQVSSEKGEAVITPTVTTKTPLRTRLVIRLSISHFSFQVLHQ